MPPRIHVDHPLLPGAECPLPDRAARHVQVLRLQPGAALTLFDGRGGEWRAEVIDIGRRQVVARTTAHDDVERDLALPVTLAIGMPANERMDAVVEKASELGAGAIQPLVCERSVLRLAGERADRKAAHWQAVAASACEQCGRNRLPAVAAPMLLRDWLAAQPTAAGAAAALRIVLSLAADAVPLWRLLDQASQGEATNTAAGFTVLSGPEGGLSPAEVALARAGGFMPVGLGPRVLRADTAPLAALAVIAAWQQAR